MTRTIILFIVGFVSITSVLMAESFQFVEQDNKHLVLKDGTMPVLAYRFDVIEHENVPKDEPRRVAGCYVHPLYGLNGEILTDNAPLDHYHQHGVFWTWPHVGIHQPDGRVAHFDLWTSDTELKQHFVKWIDKKITEDSARFEVENGWFIGKPETNHKIMSERVRVIVHRVESELAGLQTRAIDFEFLWKPIEKPISLRGSEGKSYGGFSIRFHAFIPENERSNPKAEAKPGTINTITIPSGVVNRDLPETPLYWSDYTSQFGKTSQRSGASIFVPKLHPNFPPTWLTRYYGLLAVGWPGVNDRTFQPGEEIKLRYRIWIHNNPVTVRQIEKAYEIYNSEEK